jgi:hypothetical protein
MSTTQAAVPVPQLFIGPRVVQADTFDYGYIKNKGEWMLDQGSGDRSFTATITFPQPYCSAPTVMIALTGIDTANSANTRVIVEATAVTEVDFQVVVRTWADADVFGVWGSWMALGS